MKTVKLTKPDSTTYRLSIGNKHWTIIRKSTYRFIVQTDSCDIVESASLSAALQFIRVCENLPTDHEILITFDFFDLSKEFTK